jgi:hypothetical protein
MFAAIALAGPDIHATANNQAIDLPKDDLRYDLKCIEYLLEFSSYGSKKAKAKRDNAFAPSSDPKSLSVDKIENAQTRVDLRPLTDLVQTIYDIFLNYSMIQADSKLATSTRKKSDQSSPETDLQVGEGLDKKALFKFLADHGLNRVVYGPLTAFVVAGV